MVLEVKCYSSMNIPVTYSGNSIHFRKMHEWLDKENSLDGIVS